MKKALRAGMHTHVQKMHRMENNMAVIGIDLGTTNSLVSVCRENGVQLIPNVFGEVLTPSIVSVGNQNEIYVGKIAKERLITHPERTFKEFKRDMGLDLPHSYTIDGKIKSYSAEELSAMVLKQLKEDAEQYLGEPVNEAVISVPAYFNDDQRSATRNAGRLAGLKVDRLINEPSAAALAHRVEGEDEHHTYLVFDFGGGTLDISIVDAFDNIVEIQAVSGDNHLGGKDFNELIAQEFYRKNKINSRLLSDQEKGIVIKEAELCKIDLTSKNEVTRKLYLEDQEYEMKLTNQQLIDISKDLFTRMTKPLQKALNDSELEVDDIDSVILVGGSSKMPVVRHFINSLFDTEVLCDSNPDEIVAIGAGVVAGIKTRNSEVKDLILSDICPFSLGVGIVGDVFSPIIERNQVLPCSKENLYVTARDMQEKIVLDVYQGENYTASMNLKLTTITLQIPRALAGEHGVYVRFSYDINGIFEIDVKGANKDSHIEYHESIINEHNGMSEEEIEEKKKLLNDIKISPREQNENKLVLETAYRLYEESNSEQRLQIEAAIHRFEKVLAVCSELEIKKELVRFAYFLAQIEQSKFKFKSIDDAFWNEQKESVQMNEAKDTKDTMKQNDTTDMDDLK